MGGMEADADDADEDDADDDDPDDDVLAIPMQTSDQASQRMVLVNCGIFCILKYVFMTCSKIYIIRNINIGECVLTHYRKHRKHHHE